MARSEILDSRSDSRLPAQWLGFLFGVLFFAAACIAGLFYGKYDRLQTLLAIEACVPTVLSDRETTFPCSGYVKDEAIQNYLKRRPDLILDPNAEKIVLFSPKQ